MKRTLRTMLVAFALVGLASCTVKGLSETCPKCEAGQELNSVMVGMDASRIETRAADAGDASLSAVKYYVFRQGEKGAKELVDVKDGMGGDLKANFFLPDGEYDFYAIANCSGIDLPAESALTVEQLLATALPLTLVTPTNVPMVGAALSKAINRDNLAVEITAVRRAAKVTFNIDIDLNADVTAKDYVLKAVYMSNVQGKNNLGLTGYQDASGLWYNKKGAVDEAMKSLLCYEIKDAEGQPIILTDGKGSVKKADTPSVSGKDVKHNMTFYVFPNNVSSDDKAMSGAFTARCTRIVFEVLFGEKGNASTRESRYYPTTIPNIVANKYYIVNQEIHTLGYTNPEGEGSLEDMTSATITVAPWDGPENINDTL